MRVVKNLVHYARKSIEIRVANSKSLGQIVSSTHESLVSSLIAVRNDHSFTKINSIASLSDIY